MESSNYMWDWSFGSFGSDYQRGGGLPENALITDSGDPIITDDGDYITTD